MTQKYWHKLFEFGVLIKGINGAWEIAGGFLLLFLSKTTSDGWFYLLVHNELTEDPNDRFINFLTHALKNFSSNTATFIALYMLMYGFLNVFLVIQLYRDKHWAYLATILAMFILMLYQIYRISIYHSIVLTVITIFDAFFIALIWREYKSHKSVATPSNTA